MIKNKKLAFLAKIRPGFAFRMAIADAHDGEWQVIQPKDIACGDLSNIARINADAAPKKHLLTNGDVLVTNRGIVRACVFKDSAPTIVPNSVFVVSVTNSNILLPEFLSMYLNSETGQRQIKTKQAGMTVMSMNTSQFADIVIPLPPIDQQRTLVALGNAISQRTKTMQELNELQTIILNESIKGVLNG